MVTTASGSHITETCAGRGIYMTQWEKQKDFSCFYALPSMYKECKCTHSMLIPVSCMNHTSSTMSPSWCSKLDQKQSIVNSCHPLGLGSWKAQLILSQLTPNHWPNWVLENGAPDLQVLWFERQKAVSSFLLASHSKSSFLVILNAFKVY